MIISIYFFIKGFKSSKILFLYYGSFGATLAILTRQHAISLPIALFILSIIYKRKFTKKFFNHCLVTASLPIIAIVLFYLHAFLKYSAGNGAIQYAYAQSNVEMIKQLINPITLITRVFFDSIIFFHYSVLYLAPIFIILFISILMRLDKINELRSNYFIINISVLIIGTGTLILFFKDKKLMPYKPNIFNINALTKILTLHILEKNIAATLLTIFTFIGAVIILIKVLDHFYYQSVCPSFLKPKGFNEKSMKKQKSKISKQKTIVMKEKINTINIAKDFIYIWGIIYILVAIFIGLRYDRYIFPLSIMSIFLIFDYFPWIKDNKKTFIIIYLLIYSIFMFKLMNIRSKDDISASAASYLLNKQIPTSHINGGLGFNHYYNYDYIINLYKNVKTKYPINWVKFHPMANYFIRSGKELEKKQKGLILLKSFARKRCFGLINRRVYIYKRKNNFKEFIFI